MALTPTEEGQIRDILATYSETLDLAAASTDILAALGYGDIRVIDLDPATALQAADVFYIAQSNSDKKGSIQQLSDFVVSEILPALQGQIAAGLADNKTYFIGQF